MLDPRNIQQLGQQHLKASVRDIAAQSLQTISQGDAVYVNASNRIGLARADSSTTMHAIGVAVQDIASGLVGPVRVDGLLTSSNYNFSGFVGRFGYVSGATAGGVATSAPAASGNIMQAIGIMLTPDTLLVSLGPSSQRGA